MQNNDLFYMSLFDFLLELESAGRPFFTHIHTDEENKRTYEPSNAMRELHEHFIEFALEDAGMASRCISATAYIKGSSPIQNILHHLGNTYFHTTDLTHAFEQVTSERLARALGMLDPGIDSDEARVFSRRYFLEPDTEVGLVRGSPASPHLFNWYCEVYLDRPIRALAARHNLVYTRYGDDMTFSASKPIGRKKRGQILDTIESSGLTANRKKTKSLTLTKGPLVLNGIGIKPDHSLFLPRNTLRKIKKLLKNTEWDDTEHTAGVIHGLMGLFKNMTDCSQSNMCELKLLKAYTAFKTSSYEMRAQYYYE